MIENSILSFQMDFKREVFQILGGVYLVLLVQWCLALGGRWKLNAWTLTSGFIGFVYAVLAVYEWGSTFAGTAVAIGLCISAALLDSTAAACLLASSLFLRPWELIDGDVYLGLLPRLCFTIGLGHVLFSFARENEIRIYWNAVSSVIVIMSIWFLMSTAVAPNPMDSINGYFDGFVKSIFLYFLLSQLVRTPQSIRTLLMTLMLSFFSVGVISVFQTLQVQAFSPESELRLEGFGAFTNSNDIAALMVFILPFAAILALTKTRKLSARTFGWILSVLAMAAVVMSKSRGAMLGVAAMIAVFTYMKYRKQAWLPIVVATVLLAIPVTLSLNSRSAEDMDASSSGRMTYLKAGLRMGLKNPIFGVGFDAFPISLPIYATESLEEDQHMTAHNSWVLVFAETGPIGMILFLGIFLLCLRSAWELYPVSPEFFLAMIGYGVAMTFLSHSYLIYPYLLFALVGIKYRLSPLLSFKMATDGKEGKCAA